VILTVIAGIAYTAWYRSRTASRGRLSREQAITILRSELNHVAVAEANYFTERMTFSADTDLLQLRLPPTIQVRFTRADSLGWSAVLTDTRTRASCSSGATSQDPLRTVEPRCD
jgi:hypothetical protein